jgi:PiT family inorganic phosphate transporter
MTWWKGLPTSSSHAIIGGFAGAGIAKAGGHVIKLASIKKTVLFIFLSPAVGLVLAWLLLFALNWLVHDQEPRKVQGHFRRLQLLSAAAVSLGHGGNDAQKTMGIVSALLVGTGYLHSGSTKALPVPLWIVLFAHSAIALGTLSGGWRIVKTLGSRLTDLKPISGFAAETAAGAALIGSTMLGAPVSTTHVVTGAISGVGTVQRRTGVRWPIAARIAWSWVFTMPVAGLMGALAYRITASPSPARSGAVIVALVAGLGALLISRAHSAARTPDLGHVKAG